MKVFLVGTSFRPSYGGPAVSVAALASSLARRGLEVGLWAPDATALVSTAAQTPGVTPLAGSIDAAFRTFGEPDVVHDNGLWLWHNHAVARRASLDGIPRIVSVRGMLEPWAMRHKSWKKRVAWRAYQRRDLASAAMLHASTEIEAGAVRMMLPGVRLTVIPNGIEIPSAVPPSLPDFRAQPTRTALFVGRIYPVKGLPMLLEAWGIVRPEHWQLIIAGPDEAGHRAELEKMAVRLGLGAAVSFHPPVSEDAKRALFAKSQLFIAPSLSESFGMAIGEALAYERPVLTTTATPWFALEEEGAGWLVEPSVTGLCAGLAKSTSTSREQLEAMGVRGRHFVERSFDWRNVAARFEEAYRTISE